MVDLNIDVNETKRMESFKLIDELNSVQYAALISLRVNMEQVVDMGTKSMDYLIDSINKMKISNGYKTGILNYIVARNFHTCVFKTKETNLTISMYYELFKEKFKELGETIEIDIDVTEALMTQKGVSIEDIFKVGRDWTMYMIELTQSYNGCNITKGEILMYIMITIYHSTVIAAYRTIKMYAAIKGVNFDSYLAEVSVGIEDELRKFLKKEDKKESG